MGDHIDNISGIQVDADAEYAIAFYGENAIVSLKEEPDPEIIFRDKSTSRKIKSFKGKEAVIFIKYNNQCEFFWNRGALLDRFKKYLV